MSLPHGSQPGQSRCMFLIYLTTDGPRHICFDISPCSRGSSKRPLEHRQCFCYRRCFSCRDIEDVAKVNVRSRSTLCSNATPRGRLLWPGRKQAADGNWETTRSSSKAARSATYKNLSKRDIASPIFFLHIAGLALVFLL